MEVSPLNRATPSHHPFLDGIFPRKPSSYEGYPYDYGNHHIPFWFIVYNNLNYGLS